MVGQVPNPKGADVALSTDPDDLDALRQRLDTRGAAEDVGFARGVDAALAALEQVGWRDGESSYHRIDCTCPLPHERFCLAMYQITRPT